MRLTSLLTLLLLTLPAPLLAGERLLASSNQQVTVEYTPQFLTPIQANGALRISADDAAPSGYPGKPGIPVHFLTVAVPPGSHPTARLISWEPGGSWEGSFALTTDEPGVHFDLTSYPERVRDIGAPQISSLAGMAVARIPVVPVRVAGERILGAKRMVIEVSFNAPARATALKPLRLNDLQKATAINAADAAGWGRMRTSAFSTPNWPQGYLYTFNVTDEAIYKLTFDGLRQGGVDLPSAGLPSGQIKLFGNGGSELSHNPLDSATIGLQECAIYVNDGGDGTFGPGDWLLLYGRGAGGWQANERGGVTYSLHHYAVRNTYWLNIDPAGGGKRMAEFPVSPPPVRTRTTAITRLHLEQDRFIYGDRDFAGTGLTWYGSAIDGVTQVSYPVNLEGLTAGSNAFLSLRVVNDVASGFKVEPYFHIFCNDTRIGSFRPASYREDGVQQFAIPTATMRTGYNSIILKQIANNANRGLFDWMEVSWQSELVPPLVFETEADAGGTEYISTNNRSPVYFDVTDHNAVVVSPSAALVMPSTAYPHRLYLSEFEMLPSSQFRFVEYTPPSDDIPDLFSAANRCDAIFIVPNDFYDVAAPLVADYLERTPSLVAARVRLSEIYNRFNGGVPDVAAVRNFLHYATDTWAKAPQYVVFCGDGDYNYRDIGRDPLPNFIPPYEDEDVSSDDWFTCFSAGFRPEIASGRITAQTPSEFADIIQKTIDYRRNPEFGPWRNRFTLAADDEFAESSGGEYVHLQYSEELSASYFPPQLDRVKVYEAEYPAVWGREKPGATSSLLKSINEGTLLINYMGHGNPTVWTHEKLFYQPRDAGLIETSRRQALYLAFTCDWAYWDDPSAQSFPEDLLAMPDRGAIGAIASTRLTFSGSNFVVATSFYRNLFRNDSVTIGQALFGAKQATNAGATYHFLGDPALELGRAKRKGSTLVLNPTSLMPLGMATVSGNVLTRLGRIDPSFNGQALLTLLDSPIPRQHYVSYLVPGPTVYRGFVGVTNGSLSGQFVIPRDVTLNGSGGRVAAYFYNDHEDGVAVFDSVRYAATRAATVDTLPPVIDLFLDHRWYRPGDVVSASPTVIVVLTDSSGINLTGAMGHGVMATIDDGKSWNLTPSFRYDLNSHTTGSLSETIGPLTPGEHSIKIEAWDSFNNVSLLTSNIEVASDAGGLVLERILNYPNPFKESTALTFVVNRAVDYTIKVFTVNGRKIREYEGRVPSAGLASDAVWDGRDEYNRTVGNGVYLYKVTTRDGSGSEASGIGRIALIR